MATPTKTRSIFRSFGLPVSARLRQSLGLLQLEDRLVPALGVPAWAEVGPGATQLTFNVATVGDPNNPDNPPNAAVGAVNSVLADPTNANVLYAATVNGGVWKTVNANAAIPTWTPLTDSQASLAIGDLVFGFTAGGGVDPNTLYAGTGSKSSYLGAGGPGVGILKSTDAGATWVNLGAADFGGARINKIAATKLGGGQVLLAGTALGLFRSTNGGANWTATAINGANDGVIDLARDPNNDNRFFATIAGQGVYRSNDGGSTWALAGPLNIPAGGNALGTVNRILVATMNNAGTTIVYAATYSPEAATAAGENAPQGQVFVFRSADGGTTWVALARPGTTVNNNGAPSFLGTNPGNQESNFAIAADPADPNVVYVAGDRQPRLGLGGAGYTARIYRGDASQTPVNQWREIVLAGANNTAPHADSRSLQFDTAGNLIETDDGGIARLTNTNLPAQAWVSLNGSLRVFEDYSTAYDANNNVILSGTQDNGDPLQRRNGAFGGRDVAGGDGSVIQIDSTSIPGSSVYYFSSQNLGGFSRSVVGPNDPNGTRTPLLLNVTGQGALPAVDRTIQFVNPYVLNTVNPLRMLIGTSTIYESIGALDANGQPTTGDTLVIPPGGANVGRISALAYGGRTGGAANPDVAFVGTEGANKLLLRTAAGGTFQVVAGYTGDTPLSIALDPDNWQTAYIIDSTGKIWRTANGGTTFADITNGLNLGNGITPNDFRSITLFPNTAAPNDESIFVSGFGVFGTDNPTAANPTWVKFGTALPNVLATDVRYNAQANVITAATLGRGTWIVNGASNFINSPAPAVDLNGPAAGIDNAATFTQGGGAVPIVSPLATVVNTGTALLTATVRIANIRNAGAETLAAATGGTAIAAAYNPATGVLALTGNDTAANYQQVLRSVTYTNAAATPDTTPRQIAFVFNTASAASPAATSTVTIVANNPAPTLDLNGPAAGIDVAAVFNQATGQVVLAPAATVVDPNAAAIAGATVTIANLQNGAAESLQATTAGTNIAAAYTAATGVLALTGTDTAANYQQVLRTVVYANTAVPPGPVPRAIAFSIANATANTSPRATATVAINRLNTAPTVVNAAPVDLAPISQNAFDNPGTTVAALIGTGTPTARVRDADPGAALGIAITGIDETGGLWEFSLDDGGTWIDINDLSDSTALLISDDAGSRVRFVPNAGFNGAATFTFRGWDRTAGTPNAKPEQDGALADTTVNGGSSSFSAVVGTARIAVNPIPATPVQMRRSGLFAAGSAAGVPAVVVVFNRDGSEKFRLAPFGDQYFGGVSVAVGDVTGDGVDDIVVAAGPGAGPHVKVFDGSTGAEVRSFLAYAAEFQGGVFVAVGDINGDGIGEIITGAGAGGGPHVKAFDARTLRELASFLAYGADFQGGVTVAVGDTNGDGFGDIITGAASGAGPHVKVFDGKTLRETASFFSYAPDFFGGIYVAAGDINADGFADIITGAGPGGGPHVKIFSGRTLAELGSIAAFDAGYLGGVDVGTLDRNRDGFADILVGTVRGAAQLATIDGRSLQVGDNLTAFAPNASRGIYVG